LNDARVISLPGAVPMIMGAKIGTTITASLVSLVYLNRPLDGDWDQQISVCNIIHDIFATKT
jgi:hypothetical protein